MKNVNYIFIRRNNKCDLQKEVKAMKNLSHFCFYFRLPDGREVETEIVSSSFKECLKDAQERAANTKSKIIAWVEL